MKPGLCKLDGADAGVSLAYVDWSSTEASRVVMCVHGLTRNARDFDDIARAIAARGVRVLAVDVVGRGNSSWLADPTRYTLTTYVAQLERLHTLLALPKVDWIGTSMGGLIGMLMAAAQPAIFNSLILNDVGPYIHNTALRQIQSYLGVTHEFPDLQALEHHLRFIHSGFGHLSDAQWHHLALHSARPTADRWRLHHDPAIRVPYADLAAEDVDLWSYWDRVACPTFVLRGMESPVLHHKTAEAMQVRGPRAQLAQFANVGHAPALMSDDQIFTVMHWLRL